MKTILHISDIHTSDRADQGNNESDLKQLASKIATDLCLLPKPDTIFITGDIAYSGQEGQYDIFLNKFLIPILNSLSIGIERVVLTPGNHDSNRKAWRNGNSLIRDQLCEKHDNESVNKQIAEYIEDDYKPFSCFRLFKKNLEKNGGATPVLNNPLYCAYDIDGVGIACINTAWLSFQGDKGKLMIGERQIQDLIDAIKSKSQKLVLMHHPLDWLHQDDRSTISDILYRSNISCLFYGHMHEFSMAKESFFDEDSLLRVQTGKLDLQQDGTVTGYSVLSLNEENNFEDGVLYFRQWDSKNASFKAWTERAPNGELAFSIKDETPFNASSFFEICRAKRDYIDKDLLCNIGLSNEQQRKLTEVFVCPSLTWDMSPATEAEGKEKGKNKTKSKKPKAISLDSIINTSDSLILLGGENSGKSTLAKRIAIHYLSKQSEGDLSQIFYYVDAKDQGLNKERKIRENLLGFYFNDHDASSCEEKIARKLLSRNAVILIDSCESLDAQSIRSIYAYISKNPEPRYILCAQLSARTALSEFANNVSDAKKFKFLKVSGLKRSHIRELFSNWSPSTKGKNSHSVSQAIRSITGAGMPSNPFVYTMLLSIKERKSTTYRTYMHEADLIENFIEIILEKHVLTARNDPQYKDLLLFLGFISSEMQKKNLFNLNETEMTRSVADFNNLITKNFSYNGYVAPLVQCGILRNGDGKYAFSQACFFNYALAHWYFKTETKYADIEKKINFLRFDKVFEYISAIKKNDFGLLEYINGMVVRAWETLLESEEISEINKIDFEIDKCVSHDVLDLVKADEFEREIGDHTRTQQNADEDLDELSPLSSEPVCEVKYDEKYEALPSVEFNEALSLYARAFRAAEHLMNADLSMQHFSSIFDFYMKSAALNIKVFDQKLRPIAIAKISKILDYDALDEKNKTVAKAQIHAFLNFVISAIPNWSVAMMNSDFFNQRQIERMETYRNKCESNLEKLLITYSLCELEGIDVVREISAQKYKKPYESSSLLMKAIELINFNFSINADEKKCLDDFVRKILKDRKNNKMLTNLSVISNKIHGKGVLDAMAVDVIETES